jgi:hypothetical protein
MELTQEEIILSALNDLGLDIHKFMVEHSLGYGGHTVTSKIVPTLQVFISDEMFDSDRVHQISDSLRLFLKIPRPV